MISNPLCQVESDFNFYLGGKILPDPACNNCRDVSAVGRTMHGTGSSTIIM